MKDDLAGKTLEELKELEQQLTHEINVIDQMRVRQIETAVNATGEAAKDLTNEHIDIRANVNSRFQTLLDDLHNRLAVCRMRIDRLTPRSKLNLVDTSPTLQLVE